MARTLDLISPYHFRRHELHDPKHRPKLADVRELDARFQQVQESNARLVQMLNDAEHKIDVLESELWSLRDTDR